MKSLLVYKASAGSGKTFTLAVEYIKLLIANPYAYRTILAVTFTNKATAEMKVRILGQLNGIAKSLKGSNGYFEKVKAAPEIVALGLTDQQIRRRAQQALSAMLHDYTRFRITTIDSFFQSIVRELAYELDLTANLRVDLKTKEALAEAVKSIVDEIVYYADEDDRKEKVKLLGILTNFMYERIDADRTWNIMKEIENFSGNIFKEQYLKQQEEVRQNIGDPKVLENVKRDLRKIETDGVDCIRRMGANLEQGLRPFVDKLIGKTRGVIAVAERAAKLKNEKSISKFCEIISKIPGTKGILYTSGLEEWAKDGAVRDELASLGLLTNYRALLTEIGVQHRKVVTAKMMLVHINEMMLLNLVNDVLRQKNRENNRFILADTAHFLREMIDDPDVPFIYERTGTRYKHIMIDEFQDTSELQWENFKPLLHNSLADDSRCLVVGDVKQSIYRWRNSDWRTLNDIEYGEFQEKIALPPLDTNYRSSEEVVNFNNEFFKKASRYVAQKYNEATTFEDGSNATEDRALPITTAYKEVVQKVPNAHRGYGYVRIEHLLYPGRKKGTPTANSGAGDVSMEAPERKSKKELMLDSFGDTMTHLLENGVTPRDIAVLVRTNGDGVEIADYLEENFPTVKVVSNEAFLLESSLAVSMIISALRVLANPENDVERYALATIYHREVVMKAGEVEEEQADGFERVNIFSMRKELVDALLPISGEERQRELVELPLYELCERLYELLGLEAIKGQDAYLYCFYDRVQNYVQDNRGTLDAFLTYWDETLHEVAVPMGSADGLQILTVHKSKGLEFHTVIVPFCDWSADGIKGQNRSLLWCEPQEAPFNQLKLAPVEYSSSMKDSHFHAEFNEELLRQLVDNLNILYVAFTRAENNLIVLTGKAEDQEVGAQVKDVSDIINMALLGTEKDGAWNWPTLQGEAKTYTFGTIVPSEKKDEDKGVERKPSASSEVGEVEKEVNYLEPKFQKRLQPFHSLPAAIDFRQSNDSARFLRGELEDDERDKVQYVEQGNFYHALLERIQVLDDLPEAIAEFEREGLIAGMDHKREVEDYMQRIFENEQAREWFLPKWRVLNEQNILFPLNAEKGKRFERPDRVICDGKTTIVVDYKTGGMKTLTHLEQVQDYVDLLIQMGYPNPQGYVWYLKYNEIVPVCC